MLNRNLLLQRLSGLNYHYMLALSFCELYLNPSHSRMRSRLTEVNRLEYIEMKIHIKCEYEIHIFI